MAVPERSVNLRATSTIGIRSDRLLLVEGPFDSGFLSVILAAVNRSGVQVEPIGGKNNKSTPWDPENRRSTFASIRSWAFASGASDLQWLGIALDADEDSQASFDLAKDGIRLFSRSQIPVPTRPWTLDREKETGKGSTAFIFPDGTESDDIERYIWQKSLRNTVHGTCVDSYIACILAAGTAPDNQWKARVQCIVHAHPDIASRSSAELNGRSLGNFVNPMDYEELWSQIPEDNSPNP